MKNFLQWKRTYSPVMIASLLLTMAFSGVQSARAVEAVNATLYKNPSCRCCDDYAAHLRQNDYEVTVSEISHLAQIKTEHGIPSRLQSCHTMLIEEYVIEGHVPVAAINKLLQERPEIRGISLPGMPAGSPGMTGRKQEPFVIYTITDDGTSVYLTD